MTRAVLEGVAFGLKDGLDLMVNAGVPPPESIRASGGGTISEFWRQILADVLDTAIETVSTEEGAAYGAALLALVGAGRLETVGAAVEATVQVTPAASPSPDVETYRHIHGRYQGLYPALKATFHSIAE